ISICQAADASHSSLGDIAGCDKCRAGRYLWPDDVSGSAADNGVTPNPEIAATLKLQHARRGLSAVGGTSMLKRLLAIACASSVAICAGATIVVAQDFPSKPVSLMMPYAAGGPGDIVTRVVGQGMGKALGRQVLVENVAGAGGTIGSLKVAQSPPDGYSLLVMHFGHAANIALYPNLRYDAVKDFEPIGLIAESPM